MTKIFKKDSYNSSDEDLTEWLNAPEFVCHRTTAQLEHIDKLEPKKYLDPIQSKSGKETVDSQALHPDFVSELAKVAKVSMEKGYTPYNWLQPNSPTRVSTFVEAGARHARLAKLGFNDNLERRLDGSQINVNVNHFVYAAYNYLMAALIIRDLPDHDDRKFFEGKLK